LEGETLDKQEEVSLKDAFLEKEYRFATLNGIILQFIQQYTGISFINLFSGIMFQNMKDKGKLDFSIPIAILILLWINCLASFSSSLPSKMFGQRKTLLGGQFLMIICHAFLVVFNQFEMSILVIIMLILFLLAF
jgi:hypothetical protein